MFTFRLYFITFRYLKILNLPTHTVFPVQPWIILYLDFNADAYENVKHVKNRRPVAIKIIFGFNELAVKSSSMRTVTLC